MKSTLHQSEFEALSARLLDAIEGIHDEDSLLDHACKLLKGDVALLVKCHASSSGKVELVSVHPRDQRGWAEEFFTACRAWYQGAELPETARGFPSIGPVTAGGKKFAEAIVAYGSKLSRREGSQYELIVLRELPSEFPFNTYYCAIGAGLLIPYELIVRAMESKQRAKEAKDARAEVDIYAGLVSTKILPNETWKDFWDKVKKQRDSEDRKFLFSVALLWTGYAVRRADRNEGGIEPGQARDWIADHLRDDAGDALALMDFLVDPSGTVLGETHIHSARQFIEPDHQFGMAGLLLLLEHAWTRIYRATQQGTAASGASERAKSDKTYDARDPQRDKQLAQLLKLTNLIVSWGLVRTASGGAGSGGAEPPASGAGATDDRGCDPECKTHFDRETLRMYFVLLLLGARRLQESYLWLGNDRPRRVPSEVRREFLLNLSRFLLGVVANLQRRNQVEVDPNGVSAVEALDGLLYVVDRYVHVQLEVDERLNIREHLTRALKAEVEHHMASRFYRDHLLHVIDVFLLGNILLDAQVTWLKRDRKQLVYHLSTITQDVRGEEKVGLCRRNWAVASLLHDMGYQVNLKSGGSASVEKLKDFFVLPRAGFKTTWLDPVRLDSKDGNRANCLEFVRNMAVELGKRQDKLDWLGRLSKNDSILEDHGVLSALRVTQLLAHAEMQESRNEEGSLQLLGNYLPALHAMAHHNLFGDTVEMGTDALSCILRLCDEMQEWERRRVDIEKVVKRLYLAIEEGEPDAMPEYGILDRLGTNLKLEHKPSGDQSLIDELVVTLDSESCEMHFIMHYRSPIEAHYDAITTFLSKAYSLQHVDLTVKSDGRPMKWFIRMVFPQPKEYRGITELDIYGIISQQVRGLPKLLQLEDIRKTEAGLVCILPKGADASALPIRTPSNADQIAIVVARSSGSNVRDGWLTFDPGPLVQDLVNLKREVLIKRTLGAERSWLGYG